MPEFVADICLRSQQNYLEQRDAALHEIQEALQIAGLQASVSLELVNVSGRLRIECENPTISIDQIRQATKSCLCIDLPREEETEEITFPGIIDVPQ